ncbi:hypothetical protein DFP73DRAFT_18416 [Morchella snyderi]|nr:hypothetical protein DFP73DRAFT_18416 [Morchella snyderi]
MMYVLHVLVVSWRFWTGLLLHTPKIRILYGMQYQSRSKASGSYEYVELHFPRLSRNHQFVEIACLIERLTQKPCFVSSTPFHWGLLGRGGGSHLKQNKSEISLLIPPPSNANSNRRPLRMVGTYCRSRDIGGYWVLTDCRQNLAWLGCLSLGLSVNTQGPVNDSTHVLTRYRVLSPDM